MKRRKAIPDRVKLIAALRALGLTIEEVNFDHDPPLALREYDEAARDTVPPANSPEHITMLLVSQHKTKTFGPGGEKRITTAGSDIGNIKKVRHLTKAQEEHRRRMLAKTEREDEPQPAKRKAKWPTRKFGRKQRPDRE